MKPISDIDSNGAHICYRCYLSSAVFSVQSRSENAWENEKKVTTKMIGDTEKNKSGTISLYYISFYSILLLFYYQYEIKILCSCNILVVDKLNYLHFLFIMRMRYRRVKSAAQRSKHFIINIICLE